VLLGTTFLKFGTKKATLATVAGTHTGRNYHETPSNTSDATLILILYDFI